MDIVQVGKTSALCTKGTPIVNIHSVMDAITKTNANRRSGNNHKYDSTIRFVSCKMRKFGLHSYFTILSMTHAFCNHVPTVSDSFEIDRLTILEYISKLK